MFIQASNVFAALSKDLSGAYNTFDENVKPSPDAADAGRATANIVDRIMVIKIDDTIRLNTCIVKLSLYNLLVIILSQNNTKVNNSQSKKLKSCYILLTKH